MDEVRCRECGRAVSIDSARYWHSHRAYVCKNYPNCIVTSVSEFDPPVDDDPEGDIDACEYMQEVEILRRRGTLAWREYLGY